MKKLMAMMFVLVFSMGVSAQQLTLEEGTPVKLRIGRTVSSADSQVGDTVDFEVLEEIKVGDLLVIPKGGVAWATVTDAQPKRRMGRGGKLDMNIDSVRLVDGEKAALRAVKDVKGGGHGGAMTGAIVATSLVVWPAAPLFLLMHGKDITIPKGTEITAYINGNFPINPDKFLPKTDVHVQPTGARYSNIAAEKEPVETSVPVAVTPAPVVVTPVVVKEAPTPVLTSESSLGDQAREAKQHKACLVLAKDNPGITCK